MTRAQLRADTRRRGLRATQRQYHTSLSPLRKPWWAALFAALWFTTVVTAPGFVGTRMVMAAAGQNVSGAEFFVGSFTKINATGSQAITGVGFRPKAIIFWMSGSNAAAGTWDSHVSQTVGFTTGASESYSVNGSAYDNVGTSAAARRSAAKAITVVYPAGTPTVTAEADLSSFDADGFTLNWTTYAPNDGFGTSHNICFLAIGGSDVQAKTVLWDSPTSTGNKAVSGVGFTPTSVLHMTTLASSLPSSNASYSVGFGCMDDSGGQWTNALFSVNGGAAADTARYQRTNRCIAWLSSTSAVLEEAQYVSMDADGFTVNFTAANASAFKYVSLCLTGVSAKAGAFTGGGATGEQSITGTGFRPGAVLTANTRQATSVTTVTVDAGWGMGAGDGTNSRATAQYDLDAADPTQSDSLFRNDRVILMPTNGPSVSADATLSSFDSDGFTVNWQTNPGTLGTFYLAWA